MPDFLAILMVQNDTCSLYPTVPICKDLKTQHRVWYSEESRQAKGLLAERTGHLTLV